MAQRDGVFLVTPTTAGAAGIAGYSYELKAGLPRNRRSRSARVRPVKAGSSWSGWPTTRRASSTSSRCGLLGGNGKSSEAAFYPFRVDTTPPRNLRVTSSSHGDPQRTYASAAAVFGWNRPLDFTGVKRYLYKAGLSAVLPQPRPKASRRTAPGRSPPARPWCWTWRPSLARKRAWCTWRLRPRTTPETASSTRPSSASTSSGRASPRPRKSRSTRRPAAPRSSGLPPPTTCRTASAGWRSASPGWKPAESFTDLTSWIVKDPLLDADHRFEGLDTDHILIYKASVRVVDRAGNERVYAQGFCFSGEPVTLAIPVPFAEDLHGYRIWGNSCSDPNRMRLTCSFPSALPSRWTASGRPPSRSPGPSSTRTGSSWPGPIRP